MESILDELVATGLIARLDGEDSRLEKIRAAVQRLAETLGKDRPSLLRAALAAINPDAREDDPAIVSAHDVLVEKWPTMRSVHTSVPVALLRALLLDACNLAAQDERNAAIIWNTLADQLPLARLGAEAPVIAEMLQGIGERLAESVTVSSPGKKTAAPQPPQIPAIKVERADWDLTAAVNAAITQARNPQFNFQYSQIDPAKLAQVFDDVAGTMSDAVHAPLEQMSQALAAAVKYVADASAYERKTTRAEMERLVSADQVRLDALWWYEAMYSPTLRQGYRDVAPPLATVMMVVDLLEIVIPPSPVATGYLLAEAVNRLQGAAFDHTYSLKELIEATQQACAQASLSLGEHMSEAPLEGELSIRDAFVAAVSGPVQGVDAVLARAGLCAGWSGSLPAFARSLYRQEQAVRLARAD
ncbi:hypothetical protein HHL24_37330 [Paraburkholderia sp. RP-4-7]|uniref:GTPase-associated system helical domain-containing protein n=1 Tax=Paraburkholderia polaris TaxID=2728848 RepID=A0A848ITL1_9BURK|nr:GTPase-associated system all-helical protein GASH [Paraburkholderia polaris]NMM03529.1 hypothetical protein [Paraburkholderia polaris]